jgi:hypothetical protein
VFADKVRCLFILCGAGVTQDTNALLEGQVTDASGGIIAGDGVCARSNDQQYRGVSPCSVDR